MRLWVGRGLVDRLVTRFALSLTANRAGQFMLSPVIAPVTDVDRLLRVPRAVNIGTTVTVAADYILITVPKGKRWTIRGLYSSVGDSAGTLQAKADGVAYAIAAVTANGQTYTNGLELTLVADDPLLYHCTIWNSGNITVVVFVEEEDAY